MKVSHLNRHICIVGRPGTGKSKFFLEPNILNATGSFVATDPKGELYDKTAGYLRDHGYKIKVLNLVRPQYSDGYNP